MSPEMPKFVYRLATIEEWRIADATGAVPLREMDERDGYIHLSTKSQLIKTARLHFSDAQNLLALEIPVEIIRDNLKFEMSVKRSEEFPHLYRVLRKDNVCRVIQLTQNDKGFILGETL